MPLSPLERQESTEISGQHYRKKQAAASTRVMLPLYFLKKGGGKFFLDSL